MIDVQTGDIQTLKADLLGLRRENDSLQQSTIIPTPCDVNWQQRAEGLDSQVQTLTRRLQEAACTIYILDIHHKKYTVICAQSLGN